MDIIKNAAVFLGLSSYGADDSSSSSSNSDDEGGRIITITRAELADPPPATPPPTALMLFQGLTTVEEKFDFVDTKCSSTYQRIKLVFSLPSAERQQLIDMKIASMRKVIPDFKMDSIPPELLEEKNKLMQNEIHQDVEYMIQQEYVSVPPREGTSPNFSPERPTKRRKRHKKKRLKRKHALLTGSTPLTLALPSADFDRHRPQASSSAAHLGRGISVPAVPATAAASSATAATTTGRSRPLFRPRQLDRGPNVTTEDIAALNVAKKRRINTNQEA